MKPETKIKTKLLFTAIGVLFFGVSCNTANPNIEHELTDCGKTRTLDLEPGDVVNLTDAGSGKSDFLITDDGKIFVPDVSNKVTNPDAVDYIIGEKNKPHYVVKSTGQGNGDVTITKVCPAPVTPTPTPTPEATSFSRDPQRFAGVDRHFHAAKAPHQAFGQVFRRGGRV